MPNYIANDCLITPEIKKLLAQKRQQLGLSFRDLGTYFHVSWSTFRTWELSTNRTTRCRKIFLHTLNAYLSGEYDDALRATRGPLNDLIENWRHLPTMVHQCMERITTTYELCKKRPELQQSLVDAIDNASRDALRGLLE